MSSDATPRMGLAILPPTPAQPQVTHNEALHQIDALTDICLLGQFVDTPPASPADGDTYLLGGAPTGAWSGQAYKLAYCLDGGWRFFAPFNGLRATVATSKTCLVYQGGGWTDANALISANEVSVASAATCDLGAAGSLFVAVTGSTTITSFGAGANLLRHVRFAGALTLTHNATSLILLGGASRVTAAGDCALYSSDGAGNWRERFYQAAASAVTPSFAVDRGGSDQSGLTANATNAIAFNHVAEDNHGWFDTATGRYTPQQAGLYMIVLGVALSFSSSPSDSPQAYIFRNGSLLINGSYAGLAGGASGAGSMAFGLVRFNGSTDYVDGRCFVPSGTAAIRGGISQTFLQGFRVAP